MKYFFHADTEKYRARLKRLLILTVLPILAASAFCTVNIMLNLGTEFALLMLIIICGCVLLGLTVIFPAVYLTHKLSARHGKYTYFDFLPTGMVFSRYAGEYAHWGVRVIFRRLYFIPFETLEQVTRDPKTSPYSLTLKGRIREYFFESDRLGYHITEDGALEFDTFILNENYYSELESLTIKDCFGSTKSLERSVNYYLEQFRGKPDKKPFVIADYVKRRQNPKPRTSNAELEKPSFSRKWR